MERLDESSFKITVTDRVSLLVRLSEFPEKSGQYGIDIRRWVYSQSPGAYSGATKKGVWIPVKKNERLIAVEVCKAFTHLLAEHLGTTPENLIQRVLK